jgi:thioesterase domain-containing protein/acyl carrier protein
MQQLLNDPALSKEDNFFLAGGHSLLGMQLILRIEEEFGAELSLQQILEYPTVNQLSAEIEWALDPVRKAAEPPPADDSHVQAAHNGLNAASRETQLGDQLLLTTSSSSFARVPKAANLSRMNGLRAGIAIMQPNVNRGIIFWIHYLHGNLARAIGQEYGFFAIRLTLEDLEVLGRWPSAQAIARCMVKKILQVQPDGPYVIGGMCLGGILAYEIASQLRAAGHEVSLLIMVDAWNPRYRPKYRSFREMFAHAKFVVHRARKLGMRKTLQFACKDFSRQLPRSVLRALAKTQVEKTQEIVDSAGRFYCPRRYAGRVLLVLASDSAPHKNPERGWRGLVDGSFTTLTVDGHHSELAQPPTVAQVAEAIRSHLGSTPAKMKQTASDGSLTLEYN